MTQPSTVNVELEELLARAAELEQSIPGLPAEITTLQAPCAYPRVVVAAQQLVMSANNMRLYLAAGEREWGRLAESLRNAAKAYGDVDEGAAEAIENGTSVSGATLKLAVQSVDLALLTDTAEATDVPPAEFLTVKERAWALEQPDQGAAFIAFADAWEAYRVELLRAADRFRPFTLWLGTANSAVEENFDQQREWLDQMAAMCVEMVNQARNVVYAHHWVRREHIVIPNANPASPNGDYVIDYAEALRCEETWERIWNDPNEASYREFYIEFFQNVQIRSDEVIREYEHRAELPLAPVRPARPPKAHVIEPPPAPTPDPDNGVPDDAWVVDPDSPADVPPSDGDERSDATGRPGAAPAGVPQWMPWAQADATGRSAGAPAGFTQMPWASANSGLTDAADELEEERAQDVPAGGPSAITPASVGVGGVDRRVASTSSSTPLQQPVYHEASPASAPRGAVGPPSSGIQGAGGAMGGGGMGMAPLAGHAADRGADNAKRLQREDPWYPEDRSVTEEMVWAPGLVMAPGASNASNQKR